MSKPKEYWIIDQPIGDGISLMEGTYLGSAEKPTDEVSLKYPDKLIHVIEYSEYQRLKDKHEEILSYLPKVPTQPYEKRMARQLRIAIEALENIQSIKKNDLIEDPIRWGGKIVGEAFNALERIKRESDET